MNRGDEAILISPFLSLRGTVVSKQSHPPPVIASPDLSGRSNLGGEDRGLPRFARNDTSTLSLRGARFLAYARNRLRNLGNQSRSPLLPVDRREHRTYTITNVP